MKKIKSILIVGVFCISLSLGIVDNAKAAENVGNSKGTDLCEEEISKSVMSPEPRGVYLGSGSSSISKVGTGKIAVGGTTIAQKIVSTVSVTVRVERLVNGTWQIYTSWSSTRYNAASATSSKTLSVPTGYYYRAHSMHYANTDASSSVSGGVWI